MEEVRALVGGQLMHGGGTDAELFELGLDLGPDFVASDAGSVDPGPAFLGSGKPMTHKQGLKQSIGVMLKGCLKRGVPLLIGSAGIGGARPHLDYFRGLAEEIATENGISFRLGLIDSEQDKGYLRSKLNEGRTRPLGPVPPLTEEQIDRAAHIVGMMGAEPWQKALEMGADVVIGGRSSDSALFAAVPLMHGFPPAQAWHMAKTIECGAMVSEPGGAHPSRGWSPELWAGSGETTSWWSPPIPTVSAQPSGLPPTPSTRTLALTTCTSPLE